MWYDLNILEGEEKNEHSLQLMLDCLNIIGSTQIELCQNDFYNERYLHLHEFYLKLLELYFDDGFYGIYAFYAIQRHKYLASIYLSCRNDEQKAQEHLTAAVKFAEQYESLPDGYVYTSTLFNGYKSHIALISNASETECQGLLSFINGSEFDSVRNKDWFRSIEQELRGALYFL